MTPQLKEWTGDFGNAYVERNEATSANLQSLTRMWARMLQGIRPRSILEVGANIGLNLRSIRNLTDADLIAIEPNELARRRMAKDGVANIVLPGVAGNMPFSDDKFELSFTAGVLIHIHPDDLKRACEEIARVSSRYVLCAEYYSAAPREVNYRGNTAMLWTRDFGQFYLDNVPALRCIDYGFFWPGAGAIDSLTWWLMEKKS